MFLCLPCYYISMNQNKSVSPLKITKADGTVTIKPAMKRKELTSFLEKNGDIHFKEKDRKEEPTDRSELASDKQKALLVRYGVKFPSDVTDQEATVALNKVNKIIVQKEKERRAMKDLMGSSDYSTNRGNRGITK